MKSKALIISLFATLALGYQSCDTKLNVDNTDDFYKYIGGDGNQWGVDLVTDADGNIFILGKTDSNSDGMQIYLVKTDPKGNVQWTSIFGDTADEEPRDIEMLGDGNLVLVANRIEAGERDFVIYRVSATDGAVMGTPRRVGEGGVAEYVNSITQTTDGFITASYVDNGVFKEGYVNRFYADADLTSYPDDWTAGLAQFTTGGGFDIVPTKVVQFDDNTFFTFGHTNTKNGDDFPDYNFFVYVGNQLNDGGTLLIIPGPELNSDERLSSVTRIKPESGTGFALTGYVSYAGTGQQDLYVLRTPLLLNLAAPYDKPTLPSGDTTNLRTYLTGRPKVVTSGLSTVTASGSPASVFSSAASGFLLLAEENISGNGDMYLTKVDKNLADAWSDPGTFRMFGGVGNDLAGAVAETSNGRILVVGTMVVGEVNGQSKIVLMNLSPEGMFGE